MHDLPSTESESAPFARRVLILFAHPALEKSRVNRRLKESVEALPGITFHDLYEAYPAQQIHVEREQDLLSAHDVVVFQHPFFWYSTPAMLKEWQDLVLEHGWAYGSTGTALHGKWWLHAMTTGARELAYQPGGFNGFTIRDFLLPLQQTARLCGMVYLPPFVAHGTHGMVSDEIAGHADDYRRLIEALRDDRIDAQKAADVPRLNADLDALLGGGRKEAGHAR